MAEQKKNEKRAVERIKQLINTNWTKDNVMKVVLYKTQNVEATC